MVPGMQVAQAGSNSWAVSARGFNGTLSDKLLVMIDGRSIYTPVHSGTYWDDQSVPIEDIDRKPILVRIAKSKSTIGCLRHQGVNTPSIVLRHLICNSLT